MVAQRLIVEVVDENNQPIDHVEIIAVDSSNERNIMGMTDYKGIASMNWLDKSNTSYSFTIYAIKNRVTTVAYNVKSDYVMTIRNL